MYRDNQRKISTGSSPSRTSSDDESRYTSSVSSINEGLTRRVSPPMNSTVFKMMNIPQNICPRCSKTVYSAEEVKAVGKVTHHSLLQSVTVFISVLVISQTMLYLCTL